MIGAEILEEGQFCWHRDFTRCGDFNVRLSSIVYCQAHGFCIPQKFSAEVFRNSFPQKFSAEVFCNSFPPKFSAANFRLSFPPEFKIDVVVRSIVIIINSVLTLQVSTASLPHDREPCEIKVVSNHTCSLHTCVCAGSRRVRVRLSGFRRQGISSTPGGFLKCPFPVGVCAEQSKLFGFECGLKPLGASNIGSDSKGCSRSTRKQQGLFNDFISGNSNSCSHGTRKQQRLFNDFISGNSNSCSHGTRKQQGLFNESTAVAAGSKGCFAAETSTPATREFNRFSSAPNPPRGFVALDRLGIV